MSNGLVIKQRFPFTFAPNYLQIDSSRNFSPIDIKKFDKFSYGGLLDIMRTLDFNFKTSSIDIPINKQYKNQSQVFDPANTNISFRDISLYFRITSAVYEDIASYQEMITVLEYIQQQNVI
jgi:hypothetical protein